MNDDWLAYVQKAICYFGSSLPPEEQARLDYSPESLNIIEAWLLKRYEELDDLLHEPDRQLSAGAVLYIGETKRQNLEGSWCITRLSLTRKRFPHTGH